MPTADKTSRTDLNRTVTFRSVLEEPLEVLVRDIRVLQTDGADPECRSRFEVDSATYGRILQEGDFALLPDVYEQPDAVSFSSDAAIELEVTLRPALARRLSQRGDVDEALVRELISADTDSPFLNTESWLARDVTQEIDLPEGMDGSAKLGFQTIWGRASVKGSETGTEASRMAEIVKAYFDAVGQPYEQLADDILGTVATSDEGLSWTCLVRTDDEKGICVVYSVAPTLVPDERWTRVAETLIDWNYELDVGGFEMDAEYGEVRFRTTVDLGDEPLTWALFENIWTRNLATMDHLLPSLESMSRPR